MSGWTALAGELDRWAAADRTATFWWRDDDACDTGAALDRLLALSAAGPAPLSLAVIPEPATEGLAAALEGRKDIAVLQHGWRHFNHEPGPQKAELGPAREESTVLAEVRRGADALSRRFPGALHVLVPPWNRISPTLVPRLARLGVIGLSCSRPRAATYAAPGIIAVNIHVDIVDWKGGRGFRGEEAVLDDLIGHLAARRTRACDGDEPTGILSHHLVHDHACWQFLEKLFRRTSGHEAACWLPADAVFGSA